MRCWSIATSQTWTLQNYRRKCRRIHRLAQTKTHLSNIKHVGLNVHAFASVFDVELPCITSLESHLSPTFFKYQDQRPSVHTTMSTAVPLLWGWSHLHKLDGCGLVCTLCYSFENACWWDHLFNVASMNQLIGYQLPHLGSGLETFTKRVISSPDLRWCSEHSARTQSGLLVQLSVRNQVEIAKRQTWKNNDEILGLPPCLHRTTGRSAVGVLTLHAEPVAGTLM